MPVGAVTYSCTKSILQCGKMFTDTVGAATGIDVTKRLVDGIANFSLYMAPEQSEIIQGYILTLKNLGGQKICRDMQHKIIETMKQSKFHDFFEEFTYQEQDSDPKSVASIKRLLNILKKVEDTFTIIEAFNPDAVISIESFEKIEQILSRITILEQSVRDISHLILDVQDYLQPVIGQVQQVLPTFQNTGRAINDEIQNRLIPLQALYGGELSGIRMLNRTRLIFPYILQELTDVISKKQNSALTTLEYKNLIEKEKKQTQLMQYLMQNATDKTVVGRLGYFKALTESMTGLLAETFDIYTKYKTFSQELYEKAKSNIDEIEFVIMPQLQSQLEEAEEHLGISTGQLVTEFREKTTAQIDEMRAKLEKMRNLRVMTIAYSNYIQPVVANIGSSFLTASRVLPNIRLPSVGSPTQEIDSIRSQRYETAMTAMRMKRLKDYQIEIQVLELKEMVVENCFSWLEKGNEDEFKQSYSLIQPYLLARHPALDAKIYEAIRLGNALPQADIMAVKNDIIMEIRQIKAEHVFHQKIIENRYHLTFDLDSLHDEVLEEFSEEVDAKVTESIETPLIKMDEQFYRQDLFTRIQQLELSKKVDEAINASVVFLNQTVKPRILDEIGLKVTSGQDIKQTIEQYDPKKIETSKQAKSYQRMMNAMFYLKDCLKALENPDDEYQDNITESIGNVLTGLSGHDSKSVKYVLNKLYPILTKGLWAYWELQALSSDPLLTDIIRELLAIAEPMRELIMISEMMGLLGLPLEEHTQANDVLLSEDTELSSETSSVESMGGVLTDLLERTNTVSQLLDSSNSPRTKTRQAEQTINIILEDIKNIFLDFSKKNPTMGETQSSLVKLLEKIEKFDYLGDLDDDNFELITQKIQVIYQIVQKELLKLNNRIEVKSGLLPGALSSELKLNQMVTNTFVSLMRSLYKQAGKELDETRLLSFCCNGLPPSVQDVYSPGFLKALQGEVDVEQSKLEEELTNLNAINFEELADKRSAFKEAFEKLAPYLCLQDVKYQNENFIQKLKSTSDFIKERENINRLRTAMMSQLEGKKQIVQQDFAAQLDYLQGDYVTQFTHEMIRVLVSHEMFVRYGKTLGDYYGLIEHNLSQKMMAVIRQEPEFIQQVKEMLIQGKYENATALTNRMFSSAQLLMTEEIALLVALQNFHETQNLGQDQLRQIVLNATHFEPNPFIIKYNRLIYEHDSIVKQAFIDIDESMPRVEFLNDQKLKCSSEYEALGHLSSAYAILLRLQARLKPADERFLVVETIKELMKIALDTPKANHQDILRDIQNRIPSVQGLDKLLNSKGKNKLKLLDDFWKNLNIENPAVKSTDQTSLFRKIVHGSRNRTTSNSSDSTNSSDEYNSSNSSPR